jgi:hypothetical protein
MFTKYLTLSVLLVIFTSCGTNLKKQKLENKVVKDDYKHTIHQHDIPDFVL